MGIETLTKCELCHQFLGNSKEGRKAHMKRYHNVIVTAERVPMDKVEKARIVDNVENRIGREKFFQPLPVPNAVIIPNKKYNCKRCGPTDADGFWLTDGNGICEACLKIEAGTAEAPEEIQYHD